MAQIMDTYIPDYANGVPVVSGTTWYGGVIPLYGASGYSWQVVATNGAAGTFAWCPTNMVGTTALYTVNNGALPAFSSTAGTAGVAANGTASNALNVNNVQAYFNAVYFYFTPSASGNLYVAINVRRLST